MIIAGMKKMKGHVRFDEAYLAEIERNKPARKKIDEPKTPYHPIIEEDGSPSPARDSVGSIGHSAHAEALRDALNEVVASQKHRSDLEEWTSASEDEADAMEQDEAHGLSFEDHRRKHCDEFCKVKELEEKGVLRENDNDEDNDPGRCDSSSFSNDGEGTINIQGYDEILRTIEIQEEAESLPRRQFPPCAIT